MTSAVAQCPQIGGLDRAEGARAVTNDIAGIAELMRRYVDDDPAAFAELYRRLAPRLRALFRGFGLAPGVVDDLLQATMMRAHLARTRFTGPAHGADAAVVGWYTVIGRNVARAWFREAARRMVPTEAEALAALLGGHAPEDGHVAAEAEQEIVARVQAALARLPERQRELIEMHKLREMPFAEVASRLGVRETAARVRAHRAYRALARILGRDRGEEPA